jgi:hypothetical protein
MQMQLRTSNEGRFREHTLGVGVAAYERGKRPHFGRKSLPAYRMCRTVLHRFSLGDEHLIAAVATPSLLPVHVMQGKRQISHVTITSPENGLVSCKRQTNQTA